MQCVCRNRSPRGLNDVPPLPRVLIVGSGDVYIGGDDMGVGIVVLTYQP